MLSFFAISFILYSSATVESNSKSYLNCSSDDEKDNVLIINNASWTTCINGNEELANCIIKVHGNENIEYISANELGKAYNDTDPDAGNYDSWQSVPQAQRKRICHLAHWMIQNNEANLTQHQNHFFQNIHTRASICDIPTTGNGKVFALTDTFNWHECKDGSLVYTKCLLPSVYSYPTCIPKNVATSIIEELFHERPNATTVCNRVAELLVNHPVYKYTEHTLKNCFQNDYGIGFYLTIMSRVLMYNMSQTINLVRSPSRSLPKRSIDSEEFESEKSVEHPSSEDRRDKVEYSSLQQGQYQHPGRHMVDFDSTEFYESKRQSSSLEEDLVEPDSSKDSTVNNHNRGPAASNRYVLSRPTRFAPKANHKSVHQHQRKFARPHTSVRYLANDDWSTENFPPPPPPYILYPRDVNPRPSVDFDEREPMEIEADVDFSATRINNLAQQYPSFPEDAHWKSQLIKIDSAESSDGALSDHDTAMHGSYHIPTSAELDQYSSLFRGFSQLFDGIRPFLEISATNLAGSTVPRIPQEQKKTDTGSGRSVKRRKLVRRKLVRKPIRKELQASTNHPVDEDLLNSGENQHTDYAQPWFWWPQSTSHIPLGGIDAPNVEPIDINHDVTTDSSVFGNSIEDYATDTKKEDHSSNILQFPEFSHGSPPPGKFLGHYYDNNHVTSSSVDRSFETTWHAENVARNKKNQKESIGTQSPGLHMSTEIPQATGISEINTDEYYYATGSPEIVKPDEHANNKIMEHGSEEVVHTPDNSDEYYQATSSPEIVSSDMHAYKKIKEYEGKEVIRTQDEPDALPTTEPLVHDGTDSNLLLWNKRLDLPLK